MSELKFASEAGHWYTRDGQPCYEVPNAKGTAMRPTTLRDARKLDLVPSVTTIMKLLAAPQLEMWKVKQAVMQARHMRRRKGEDEESFAIRAYMESQEQVRQRAINGSLIHGALEQHFLEQPYDEAYDLHVASVLVTLRDVGLDDEEFLAEKSFAAHGYGGKVDLHSANWVIDFKTKDEWEKTPSLYDNHAMQIAAYRMGLGVPDARGAIIFVSEKGQVHFEEIPEDELFKGWHMFKNLRNLWYAMKGL